LIYSMSAWKVAASRTSTGDDRSFAEVIFVAPSIRLARTGAGSRVSLIQAKVRYSRMPEGWPERH